MVNTPKHVDWLAPSGETLVSSCGKPIEVLDFKHDSTDPDIMSAWATHFREQYCAESEIDFMRRGTGLSRADYLEQIKFPCSRTAPGPSTRAGDFAEILISDYLEFRLNYWVPRTRYDRKVVKNESTKGSDIIGFHFYQEGETSPSDTLTIVESKAKFTGRADEILQTASEHSIKDSIRKAESLNAIKQRFYDQKEWDYGQRVERFQNTEDNPYREMSGAVAFVDESNYDSSKLQQTSTETHPNKANLFLIVVKGEDMMTLTHLLYQKAIDEA